MRILIADDDRLVRDLIAACVNLAGHDPDVAQDGEEALTTLNADSGVDLLITDWDMPRARGCHVLLSVRSDMTRAPRDLPVIVVSGYDDGRAQICKDAGAVFIEKPFDPQTLIDTINRLLPGSEE